MGNTTLLSTDQLIDLLNSCYQHMAERTVSIEKTDKMLMYSIETDDFYTATAFNIWDTIDPVKGIEDNLSSTKSDYALSANQGRVLKELHDTFYKEFGDFVQIVEDAFIEVGETIIDIDGRLTIIETNFPNKADYRFYKTIEERDADIVNVKKGTIAITTIDKDIDISILDETNKYIKDTTFTSKSEFNIFKEDVILNKANTNLTNVSINDFHDKGIASGLLGSVPDIQATAELYLTGYDDVNDVYILSDRRPSQDFSFNWNITTSYSSKRFRFTYADDGIISPLSRFEFILRADSIEVNRDYDIKGEVTCYVNGLPYIIGYNTYNNRFPVSNVRIEIPLENNNLPNNLNRSAGDWIEIGLGIKKSGGSADNVTIKSTVGEPSKFVRNGGDIGSNNVLDFNGVDTKSVAYRLQELSASHNEFIPKTEKRQPNGVACLDENGKVHVDELPNFILGQVLFGGTAINTSGECTVSDGFKSKYGKDSFTITALNSSEVEATYFIAAFAGIIVGLDVQIGDWIISNGVNGWAIIDNTDAVVRVNGKVGDVVLTKDDIGLTNVDNTSDVDKRVSYASTAGAAPASDVYSWAKQPTKPAYNANEVGCISNSGLIRSAASASGNIETCIIFNLASAPATSHTWVGGATNFSYMYNGASDRYLKLCNDGNLRYGSGIGYEGSTIWHTGNLPAPISNGQSIIHARNYVQASNLVDKIISIQLGLPGVAGEYPTIASSVPIYLAPNNTYAGYLQYDVNVAAMVIGTSNNNGIYFRNNNSNPSTIYGYNFAFLSDANYKKDFKQFDDFNIDDIRLEWYRMKSNDDLKFGVIAQDIQKYIPEFVMGKEWSEEEPNNHLSVSYTDVLFLMIAKLRKDVKELKQYQKIFHN